MPSMDRAAKPGEYVVTCPDYRHISPDIRAARAWRDRTEINCSWNHQIHDHEGVLISE